MNLEQIKNRLPKEFSDQVFNNSDMLVQISSLVTQYHNERIFSDNAQSILNAVKNILTDSYMIHQIEDVLSSRVTQ